MKKYLKQIDPAVLILVLYVCIVWYAYLYLNVTTEGSSLFWLMILTAAGSWIFFQWAARRIRKLSLARNSEMGSKEKLLLFMLSAAAAFAILLLYFCAYAPGSFSQDSINQYGQAAEGVYNDWHPVWHTVLFFTIPLKIFGKPSAIILLQLLYFSLLMGYLAVTVCELCSLRAAILSLAYILLNPYTGCILLYPWKDIGFAMGGLFCTIMAVRLIEKKKNAAKLWKLIAFGAVTASITIFRHNAILFTAPLLLVLILNLEKKTWIQILAFTMASFLIIKGPVYHMLNVEKPEQRVLETMGLPLTIIGNVAKETPEAMDEELSDFVYAIAPQEMWDEHYHCGSFNSIKWAGIDTDIVEEEGYAGMLHLMVKCFRLSPTASFRALFALTDIVYGFETGLEGDNKPLIVENSYGIAYSEKANRHLAGFLESYAGFVDNSLFRYLRTYGIALLALLFAGLSRLRFSSWKSWKKMLLMLPVFTYDFGTMLLLTGADSRFFFITFLAAPLMIVYEFCKEGNEENA